MSIRRVWRSWLVGWFGLLAMAVANGVLRNGVTQPALGEEAARRLATVLLLVAMASYVWWFERRHPLPSSRVAVAIGLTWMSMTLAFEIGLGLATGMSREQMLEDYDVTAGRIWPLVPLGTAVMPALARWSRTRSGRAGPRRRTSLRSREHHHLRGS